MSLATYFNPAPAVRPMLNVGAPFDVPTGEYITGEFGESILNGGMPLVSGVSGRGESGKSLIADFFMLSIMDRYGADGVVYDTEETKTQGRVRMLTKRFPNLEAVDLFVTVRLMVSSAAVMPGEAFFTALKNFLHDKKKNSKPYMKTTPFIVRDEPIKIITPTGALIDSFSQWLPSVVNIKHDKNDVGSSELNMEAIDAGRARSQLMSQLPALTSSTGCYIILTAHLGDETLVDDKKPSKKKLGFLRGDQKMKRVPENYTFLTNNLWMTHRMSVLKKSGTTELEYPLGLAAESEDQTDLSIIELQLLRSKSPAAGRYFDVVVSRIEGVLPHLTQFHYIKECGRWGLGGNLQNYYLELVPDISLSRTTVRRKIDENAKLRRALEITSEMLQLKQFWNLSKDLQCTPKELYDDLKAKGYDWDVLLNTRSYWLFAEDITPDTLPFLSTMDLLKMRCGTYHPYWLKR